jgi:hypothetical protein
MKTIKDSAQRKTSAKSDENTIAPLTLRDKYLLEIEQIKNEVGTLEQMRERLGLSQRKMCQLLMVDPSAWTRWSKTGAPPHIYQSLKWLIELKKVNPHAVAPNDISSRVDFIQSSTQTKLQQLESQVSNIERALTITPVYQPASTEMGRFQAELAELKETLQAVLTQQQQPQKKKPAKIAHKNNPKVKNKKRAKKITKARKPNKPARASAKPKAKNRIKLKKKLIRRRI